MPPEFMRYQYRKIFGLSAKEMEEEPLHEFFTNFLIYGYIQLKKQENIKRES